MLCGWGGGIHHATNSIIRNVGIISINVRTGYIFSCQSFFSYCIQIKTCHHLAVRIFKDIRIRIQKSLLQLSFLKIQKKPSSCQVSKKLHNNKHNTAPV
jgi:hypothetical protein